MDSEQSCDHSKDVAFRCEQPGWSGLRLGALADTCNLQFITIEKAGLFDYITNEFGPGTYIYFLNLVKLVQGRLCKNIFTSFFKFS